MKMKLVALSIFTILVLPGLVQAQTFVRTGNQFEVPQDQVIDGNFLAVGNPVSHSGVITKDAVLIGSQVTVTGETANDLLTVAILARLDGTVSGDVRVIGGTVTLSGDVSGDVLVVADTVEILSGTSIDGDVLLYARTAVVSGDVGGSVKGSIRNLQVMGDIGGSVDVAVNQLTLGESATVAGSVLYASDNTLVKAIGTDIGGEDIRTDPVTTDAQSILSTLAMPFGVVLFASLAWSFLARRTLQIVTQQSLGKVTKSLAAGVMALVLVPLLVVLLAVSLLGLHAAGVLLFAFLAALLVSIAAMPAVLGQWVLGMTSFRTATGSPVTIMTGAVLCLVIYWIPYIGMLVLLVLLLLVLGGLVNVILRAVR